MCINSLQLIGSRVTQIAIKTGDKDHAGTDIPMMIEVCDTFDTCCQTRRSNCYHNDAGQVCLPPHQINPIFGDDRERNNVNIYKYEYFLGDCNSVSFPFIDVMGFPTCPIE